MKRSVRELVLARDEWSCLRCGRDISYDAYSIHHRKGRSGPNADCPSNLVTLCGTGTTGCHGYIESHRAESYDQGWLVRRLGADVPAEVPITGGDLAVFLKPDGTVTYSPWTDKPWEEIPA